MTSTKQIEANRSNSLRSTGPRSEGGKASSSVNALKHGLAARQIVIRGESQVMYEQLFADVSAEFDPQGATEVMLVEQLVSTLWRLRRVPLLEAALLDWIANREMESPVMADPCQFGMPPSEFSGKGDNDLNAEDERYFVGRMIEAALNKNDTISKLSRYEAQLTKQLDKCFDRLRKLIKQRLEIDQKGLPLVISAVVR